MEQPQGNSDDLQPQDLSSTLPTVIDLTSRSEECHLKDNSMEALRTVRSPSWYTNSGSSKGLPSPETANDHRLQSGGQIQTDNSFSNTTVTLSYVSRSHVFSTHDTVSQHSPLYGLPMDEAHLCKDMTQHYLQQVDMPLDLASQSQRLNSVSPTQVASEHVAGVCQMQQSHALNGEYASSNGTVVRHTKGSSQDHHLSRDTGNYGGGLLNSQSSRSHSGSCVESSPELHQTDSEEREKRRDSDVLFLFSSSEEPDLIQDGLNPSHLCAQVRDYISPLEDPVSPSATSLDDVGDVFVLPQASSSPSADNSFTEETAETSWDELERAGQETRSNTNAPRLHTSGLYQKAVHELKAALEPVIDLTDDSIAPEALEKTTKETDTSPHLNGNAKTLQKSFERKKLPPRIGRGTRLEAIVMNINPSWYKVSGSVNANKKAKASQSQTTKTKAVSPKKETLSMGQNKVQAKAFLPSGTATKLHWSPRLQKDKNSMNTNANSCKESTSDSEHTSFPKYPHITSPKKSSPLSAIGKGSKKDKSQHMSCPGPTSNVKVTGMSTTPCQKPPPRNKVTGMPTTPGQKTPPRNKVTGMSTTPGHKPPPRNKVTGMPTTPCQKTPPRNKVTGMSTTPGQKTLPRNKVTGMSTTPCQKPSPRNKVTGMSTPPGQKPSPRNKGNASGSKVPPTAKSKGTPPSKRKRKKHNNIGQPSMYSPKEPEIRLKYVNYKEEKRDLRMMDTFSPFIRIKRKQSPSTCRVINYPEEDKARLKKGQQQSSLGGFIPGAVPTTSCLQLGRLSGRSQYQNFLVCCLCGGSTNAMDLGDLHGPYYPEGYRPSAKTPVSTPGHKEEEEDSDSDSSCSVRGRGRKLARNPAVWPRESGPRLNHEGLLGNHTRWTSDSDPSASPSTKRPRTEAGSGPEPLTGAVEDWYSPPVVPMEPCEYWLHEDCSIWSAGVFLVKGKVYGLEEAVKLAQETTCSGCHNPGATLGCFFKGCPNKYHYRCALQSDCVLIEENFSMKCRKHKNKSFKSPPGNRRGSR